MRQQLADRFAVDDGWWDAHLIDRDSFIEAVGLDPVAAEQRNIDVRADDEKLGEGQRFGCRLVTVWATGSWAPDPHEGRVSGDTCDPNGRSPTVAVMTPTPEQGAAMWEAAHRLRAELRHISGTHRLARIKIESPELIEAVQEVADALDAVDPPQQLPGFFP